MSNNVKYPELDARSCTLALMSMMAPIQILKRPEFQKVPANSFHPFEAALDGLPDDAKTTKNPGFTPEDILQLYNRYAAYEDAVCTACCTPPGAVGVTAVMVEYLETKRSSFIKFLEGNKDIDEDADENIKKSASSPYQRIGVAVNEEISDEKKTYITDVLGLVQKIDFAMDSIESKDDRKKAEGLEVHAFLLTLN